MDQKTQNSSSHDHNLIPSNPNHEQQQPSKHGRIMEKLKTAVLLRLSKLNPNKPLSPAQIATIERRLAESFPAFHTPTHLPYETMIPIAIKELNGEGGSSENAISEYILTNYEGLPWAHKRFLSHYLNKLCQKGEIVCISGGLYTFPELIPRTSLKNRQLRRKPGRKRKESVVEEGNKGGGELIGDKDNGVCFQEEEIQTFGKSPGKRRRRLVLSEGEEEGEGREVVVGIEKNMVEGNEMPVTEGRNDVLELVGGDGKDSMLEKHDAETVDGVYDGATLGKGSCEVQLGESTVEQMVPKCHSEVRTEVFDPVEEGGIREEAANVDNNNIKFVINSSHDEEVVTTGESRDCLQCGQVFSSSKALYGHMQIHAPNSNQDEPTVEKLVPKGCQGEVRTECLDASNEAAYDDNNDTNVINVNERAVITRESWVCRHCSKVLSSGRALGGHMKAHSEKHPQRKKPNKTTTVGNPTSSPSPTTDLQEHMLSHPILPAEREEMTTDNLAFANDPIDGKSDPHLPLVPSTKRILPTEREDELRTETLKLDSESSCDNLILVPVESVNESTLAPTKGDPIQASVSNAESDTPSERYKKVALMERDRNSCAAGLMIVPFEGELLKPAVKKDIICGLTCQVPVLPQKVYRKRKKMKHQQERPPQLLEKSKSASLVSSVGPRVMEHEQLCKVSLQKGGPETEHNLTILDSSKLKDFSPQHQKGHKPPLPTPMISLEVGSIEHDSKSQKLHSEFSRSSDPRPKEDDDFNIPLQQVLKKAKKHSSKSSAKQQAELPASENPSRATPQRGEEVTFANKNQMQGQQQQPKRQLRSWGREHYIEPDTFVAPEGEILSSSQVERGKNNGLDQEHEQKEVQDLGSSPNVEWTAETLSSDNQQHELGELRENQQTTGDHGLCSEPGQTVEVNLSKLSPTQKNNGRKGGGHNKGSCPNVEQTAETFSSDNQQHGLGELRENQQTSGERLCPEPGQTMEVNLSKSSPTQNNSGQKGERQDQGSSPNVEQVVEPLSSDKQQHELGELKENRQTSGDHGLCSEPGRTMEIHLSESSPTRNNIGQKEGQKQQHSKVGEVGCFDSETVKITEEEVLPENQQLQTLEKQRPEPKREGPGLTPKEICASDFATEPSSLLCHDEGNVLTRTQSSQQQIKQPKWRGRGRRPKQKASNEEATPMICQFEMKKDRGKKKEQSSEQQNIQLEIKRRGRPRKQKGESKDSAASLTLPKQQQEGLSESALVQQDGSGPRTQIRATVEDGATPLDLRDQLQEEPSKPATPFFGFTRSGKPKRDGRGRPRKLIEAAVDVQTPLKLHDHQPHGQSESTTHHLIETDGQMPIKEKKSTIAIVEAQLLNDQPATYQLKKKDGGPKKEKEATTEDVAAALDLLNQQHEESSSPNSHDQKHEPKPAAYQLRSKDGRGRPERQEAIKDVAAAPNLHVQQQKETSEPATTKKKKDGQRRPRKKTEATMDNVTPPPNFQDRQHEGPAAPNFFDQQKEASAEQSSHQQQEPSEPPVSQLKKEDGLGRRNKQKGATAEDLATVINVQVQQQEGPVEQSCHQLTKKDGRRLRKKEATLEDVAAPQNYHDLQQDGLPKPAIHTSPVASSVLCQLDQKKSQHHEIDCKVSCPDSEVFATSKAPASRLTRSSQLRLKQKEHRRDEACKSTTFSDSHIGLGKPSKSPPASAVSNNEPHQQEKELKEFEVESQLQSSDKQPRELQIEVHGVPSEAEPIMILSHDEEYLRKLREQGMVPKQKSAKTKPIQVPLSSKDLLRSRTKRQ